MNFRYLKVFVAFLLVCVLASLVGGCGTSTRAAVSVKTAAPAVSILSSAGHPCVGDTYTMGCALVGPLPLNKLTAAPGSVYGVDGWGPSSVGALRSYGAHFDATYFSSVPSKNWTAAAANADHAAGIGTVGVFENGATDAEGGYARGVSQARLAASQAAAVGNTSSAIDFAIDCECSGPSVLSYFQGVHAVLGSRDNAYGDYSVILYLYDHGVVGHLNWQTLAWSGGAWLPASIAPLEQYQLGNAVDSDRALLPDYGQFPYVIKPVVSPFAIFALPKVTLYGQKVSERLTVEKWWSSKCQNPVRREVCRTTRTHLAWLHGRLYYLALNNSPGDTPDVPQWKQDNVGKRYFRIGRILTSR